MDVAFNSYKIKYLVLDELIGPSLRRNNIKNVNLFINLDWINFRFRSVQYNTRFQACGASAFKQYTANVFNLIAHYKKWFSRHGLKVKCFIYFTNAQGGFTSALINRQYREDFLINQSLINSNCYYVNQTINGAIPLITKMCDYIDGIYIINSKGEEPSVVPYLIQSNYPADWNYMLTKDRLEMQYVNYDKFSIIYPSYNLGDRVVTAGNLWKTISDKEHKYTDHIEEYDPKLFLPAMAIAGDYVRSIRKIKAIGWGSILDYLEEIWCTNQDHSIVTMLDDLRKILSAKTKATEEKYLQMHSRNILIMSMKSRYEVMSEVNKAMMLSQLKDIPDMETINEISNNPMILGNYPINVEALFANTYVNWESR